MNASAEKKEWKTAAPVDGTDSAVRQPSWWPPRPARVYIETVRIHWRTFSPSKLTELRSILKVARADLQWDKVHTKRGRQGAFTTVHRMTMSDAIALHKFCEANADLLPNLNRFDLAVEYPRHPEMTRWLKQNIILVGCPPGWMASFGECQYWHFIPVDYEGEYKRAPTRALKCYDDRGKFDQEVSRIEVTFQTTQSNSRLGFKTIADLITMDPMKLLRDHVRLVDYDPELVLRRMVRKTLKQKLKSARPSRTASPRVAEIIDRYRDPAYLRARIADHYTRCGTPIETAQGYKDSQGERAMRRWRAIDVDVLNVPAKLWWPKSGMAADSV